MEKSKKSTWFYIIIIFAILAILIVGIVALSKGNAQVGNQSLSQNSTNSGSFKTVYINGIGESQTINYPNQKVILKVNGDSDNITAMRGTIVSEIYLNGNSNLINLCKDNPSPQMYNNGQGNNIDYVSC